MNVMKSIHFSCWCFQVDITETIKNQLAGKPKASMTNMSATTKAKLARKRQKETLKFIQQQQQQTEAKCSEPQASTSKET